MARGDIREYQILGAYLSLMINGDDSGLDEYDLKQWREFVEREKLPRGHWSTVENEGGNCEGYFGRDDVTGLHGTVYDVEYVIME